MPIHELRTTTIDGVKLFCWNPETDEMETNRRQELIGPSNGNSEYSLDSAYQSNQKP